MAADTIKYAIGNASSTTLSSGMTNTDTSAPLTSDTNFAAKSGEGMVILDEGAATEELAYATTKSGGALTIPLANRGLEGGSAQAHSAGASVKGIVSAAMWNDLADSVLNILDKTTGDIDHAELTGALYAADAGSNDTYAITLSPVPASYTALTGLPITFKANTINTGAATLNVNSLGAKTIKKLHDQDLADGDIESGQTVTVVYDGTNFQMQSQIANAPTGVGTDGWITSADTFVYASATTFTISGVDRTTTFTKGTRLKLTNSSTKYFVVVSSSFATNTTVTVTGGTDYTLANTTISSPYYSYEQNPQGYPGWFAYTPTYTGFSADPSGGVVRFKVDGTTCTFNHGTSSAGTSNSGNFTITVPVTGSAVSNYYALTSAQAMDNGSYGASPGLVELSGASDTALSLSRDLSGTGFTASGSKNARFILTYEI